jgi:hypothetical protein
MKGAHKNARKALQARARNQIYSLTTIHDNVKAPQLKIKQAADIL